MHPYGRAMRLLLATVFAFLALAAPAHAGWIWPASGDVVTPYRNGTDPYAAGQHRGIDIAAPVGAPVVAAAGGEVLFAGTAGSSGLTISIRTADGYDTSYLHLSSLAVREGARVSAGDRIGDVGTTGTRSATQPHLHFGVRDAGIRHAYHDPMGFLPPPGVRAPDAPPAAAPEPAPAPPAAARAPVPRTAPISNGQPLEAPARRLAPAARPAPGGAPRRAGAMRPAPEARPEPRPGRSTVARRVPGGTPTRARAGHATRTGAAREAPHPSRAPVTAWAGGEDSATRSSPASGVRGTRHGDARARAGIGDPGPQPSNGPNLGWALACAGLLLAAGILGLTEGGSNSSKSRRVTGGAARPRVASAVNAVLRHHAHLLRQR
jgi:Peptidase family M23